MKTKNAVYTRLYTQNVYNRKWNVIDTLRDCASEIVSQTTQHKNYHFENMGIAKTINALGEYDFYSADYRSFCQTISRLFGVNLTVFHMSFHYCPVKVD